MGGWSDKTKLILISTSVEVEVEVELGNTLFVCVCVLALVHENAVSETRKKEYAKMACRTASN